MSDILKNQGGVALSAAEHLQAAFVGVLAGADVITESFNPFETAFAARERYQLRTNEVSGSFSDTRWELALRDSGNILSILVEGDGGSTYAHLELDENGRPNFSILSDE